MNPLSYAIKMMVGRLWLDVAVMLLDPYIQIQLPWENTHGRQSSQHVCIFGAFSCTYTCYFHSKKPYVLWHDRHTVEIWDVTVHQTWKERHVLFTACPHTPNNKPTWRRVHISHIPQQNTSKVVYVVVIMLLNKRVDHNLIAIHFVIALWMVWLPCWWLFTYLLLVHVL